VDRVLIVGAGIAGVALARVLHRHGIPAVVFDRMTGPPDAPLGVNLPGNGIQALGAAGVADGLSGLGVPVRRREYRSAKGRLLFAVDEDAFWGSAARSRCVRRGDLLDLLAAGLPAGTIRWDAPVTAIRQTTAGVELELADGTIEAGGFAVGADGVHSVVRTAVLGHDGLRTALLSAASWRFSAPDPGVDCWTVWSGAQGSFLLIPVDTGEVYGYASATRGGPVDPDPEWLRLTFGSFPAPVPDVVASALALYHSPAYLPGRLRPVTAAGRRLT